MNRSLFFVLAAALGMSPQVQASIPSGAAASSDETAPALSVPPIAEVKAEATEAAAIAAQADVSTTADIASPEPEATPEPSPTNDDAQAKTVAEVETTPKAPALPPSDQDSAAPESSALPLSADALAHAANTAEAVNPFGLKVLSESLALSPKDNHLVSPLSLATALGLLAEGAAGDTLALLRAELGLEAEGLAPSDLGSLGQVLADTAGIADFRTAQGIWLAVDLTPQATFIAAGREQFAAEVEAVDFADPGTLERLNGWFSERTGGLIDPMFARLDDATRFVLGNALYFKAAWQQPFDPAQTRPAPFHTPAGTQEVSTLHGNLSGLAYREENGAQAVRLPFQDGDFELIVLLPDTGQPLAGLLSPEALPPWLRRGGWEVRSVNLALPKLDLSVGGDASEALRKAGLAALFAKADLSRLAKEPLAVDQVVHKVALKLDEQGAEAAAATAVLGVRSAAPMKPAVSLTVDRPFVIAIRHNATGALVLAGVIQSP